MLASITSEDHIVRIVQIVRLGCQSKLPSLKVSIHHKRRQRHAKQANAFGNRKHLLDEREAKGFDFALACRRRGDGQAECDLLEIRVLDLTSPSGLEARLPRSGASSPSTIAQYAALAALSESQDFRDRNRREYEERRDLVVGAIAATPGLELVAPQSAFYAYVNCAGLIGKIAPSGQRMESDEEVARELLESEGLAIVPGTPFGLSPYFRLSFCVDRATLSDGLKRLHRFAMQVTNA